MPSASCLVDMTAWISEAALSSGPVAGNMLCSPPAPHPRTQTSTSLCPNPCRHFLIWEKELGRGTCTWRWAIILGGGPVITRVFIKGRRSESEERSQGAIADSEIGRGHKPRMRRPLEAGKGKHPDASLETPEGAILAD